MGAIHPQWAHKSTSGSTISVLEHRYKLSALEIERVLLEHSDIAEAVVVGVDDDTWGQRVGAICRLKTTSGADKIELTVETLRQWAAPRMASYKVPSRLLLVDAIPKNAMGKVNKKELVTMFP